MKVFPFQKLFRAWQVKMGLADGEAARLLGCSAYTVHNYSIGKSLPPNVRVPAIAPVLGISERDLLDILLRDRTQRARKALAPAEVTP